MTPNDEPVKPIPPVSTPEVAGAPDVSMEPPGWTITADDIGEIEASGLTLGDVIREIEDQIASAKE